MIARLRARRAAKVAAAQQADTSAFVDEVAAEAMRPRYRVTRPAWSEWDRLIAATEDRTDPLAGHRVGSLANVAAVVADCREAAGPLTADLDDLLTEADLLAFPILTDTLRGGQR